MVVDKRIFLWIRGRSTAARYRLYDTVIDSYEPVESWVYRNKIPARYRYANKYADIWLEFNTESDYVEFVLTYL